MALTNATTAALSLAEIYDDAFFAEYGRENREYARAASFIGDEIHRRFQPRTVVDWGCGAGLHAGALARRGARVVGVDGVIVAARHRGPDVDYRVADLTRAVSPDLTFPQYDLSLCIDVLEHLAEADSGVALANVARGAALVILSCAPPGQGGHHHVNHLRFLVYDQGSGRSSLFRPSRAEMSPFPESSWSIGRRSDRRRKRR